MSKLSLMKYIKIAECPKEVEKLIDLANSRTNNDEDFEYKFGMSFNELKRQMRFIAMKCTLFSQNIWGNSVAFSKFEMDFSQTLYFRIIESKIVFAPNRITDTLQGVDAKRIRICPICNDFFWAKRIEAQPCSKKRCSNNFHQRERRIKEYEKRLSKEITKLEKLQLNLSPENSLISQQSNKTEKLSRKIKIEKRKNQFTY